jgi:hypothetical protein
MRRLPHQSARHSTVDHGDASDGVFLLLHLWVLPSRERSPSSSLYLVDGLSGEWLSSLRMVVPPRLRVEESSRARKGGANRPLEWARPVGPGRPAQAHPGPVRSPLRSCGSSCIYALCPLHLHHFDDVILASKMEVLLAWSPVFYASILRDVPL